MSDRYTPAEALDLLVDNFDEELDGWSAIVADAAAEPARRHGVRGMPSLRRGTRIRLGLLAAGVAAVAALIVTSPWKTTGPAGISDAQAAQILRNVQAATAPRPGWVLHLRMRTTSVLTPARKSGRAYLRLSGERESWERPGPPVYRLRSLFSYRSQSLNSGLTITTRNGCHFYDMTFDPATNTIYRGSTRLPSCAGLMGGMSGNASVFRHEVATGMLKVVARTRIDGEDVYQLEFCVGGPPCSDTGAYYVDAQSYRLVREVSDSGPASGEPLGESNSRVVERCYRGYERMRTVKEYKTWEYLPPTAANLALTDIRRQHPDARISTSHLPRGSKAAASFRDCKRFFLS